MAQQRGAGRVLAGKGIVAVLVIHRNVQVHAAARAFGEGLGHEGCLKPVGHRHALDQPLVHDRIVSRTQRVRLVPQGEFELAGGIFADPAFQRQALNIASLIEVIEEWLEILHFAQAIDLNVGRAVAGDHAARRDRAAILHVAEIEFQLDRDHWGQAFVRQPVNHAA